MKITLIGGEAHGKSFEIKENSHYIEVLDSRCRVWIYEGQLWNVDGDSVMFYVMQRMGSEKSEKLIREVLSASKTVDQKEGFVSSGKGYMWVEGK